MNWDEHPIATLSAERHEAKDVLPVTKRIIEHFDAEVDATGRVGIPKQLPGNIVDDVVLVADHVGLDDVRDHEDYGTATWGAYVLKLAAETALEASFARRLERGHA